MIVSFPVVSTLVLGGLALIWSNSGTKNFLLKLFLAGMTVWGVVSLFHR